MTDLTAFPENPHWNDPILDACEGAICPCSHEVIEHAWSGCEECLECKRSAVHAALACGVVVVRVEHLLHAFDRESGMCRCGTGPLTTKEWVDHYRTQEEPVRVEERSS